MRTAILRRRAVTIAVLPAALLVGVATPRAALAWGDLGHQIVARIAADQLTPQARRNIVALVRGGKGDDLGLKKNFVGKKGDPQPKSAAVRNAMAAMATWPDHMPGGKGVTSPWHFIDVGLFEDASQANLDHRCGGGCVTGMITTLVGNLKANESLTVTNTDGTPLTFRPDRELRFLIHFMGDVHQPLHAVTNADAGGNCVAVVGFEPIHELHAVWDTALVNRATFQLKDSAKTFETIFHDEIDTAKVVTDPADIARESFAHAKSDVYAKTTPAVPTIDHFVELHPAECHQKAPQEIRSVKVDGKQSFANTATKKLVREQLFKAGVRLGNVLNGIFG